MTSAAGILTFGNACTITSPADVDFGDFGNAPIREEGPASINSPREDAEDEE